MFSSFFAHFLALLIGPFIAGGIAIVFKMLILWVFSKIYKTTNKNVLPGMLGMVESSKKIMPLATVLSNILHGFMAIYLALWVFSWFEDLKADMLLGLLMLVNFSWFEGNRILQKRADSKKKEVPEMEILMPGQEPSQASSNPMDNFMKAQNNPMMKKMQELWAGNPVHALGAKMSGVMFACYYFLLA